MYQYIHRFCYKITAFKRTKMRSLQSQKLKSPHFLKWIRKLSHISDNLTVLGSFWNRWIKDDHRVVCFILPHREKKKDNEWKKLFPALSYSRVQNRAINIFLYFYTIRIQRTCHTHIPGRAVFFIYQVVRKVHATILELRMSNI